MPMLNRSNTANGALRVLGASCCRKTYASAFVFSRVPTGPHLPARIIHTNSRRPLYLYRAVSRCAVSAAWFSKSSLAMNWLGIGLP